MKIPTKQDIYAGIVEYEKAKEKWDNAKQAWIRLEDSCLDSGGVCVYCENWIGHPTHPETHGHEQSCILYKCGAK